MVTTRITVPDHVCVQIRVTRPTQILTQTWSEVVEQWPTGVHG